MERDKLITAVWATAGLIALGPAMCFIFLGILLLLTLLPTLPKALVNLDGYSLPFIARTASEVIGGCAGLLAAWVGILIPRRLQTRPNLKRIFLVFACAGVGAMWGYIPEEGWRHVALARFWIMLGPVIVGLCGLYRVFGARRPSASRGHLVDPVPTRLSAVAAENLLSKFALSFRPVWQTKGAKLCYRLSIN